MPKKTMSYLKGNLIHVNKGIIVHGCNSLGVMGAGVAKVIKDKYPECYKTYSDSIKLSGFSLGDVSWYEHNSDLLIANAITQQHVGTDKRQVDYEAIAKCFEKVYALAIKENREVFFPKIGAGLGGGDWKIISTIIENVDGTDQVYKYCVVPS